MIPPDDLIRSIKRLSSQVHHLRFDKLNESGPKTLKNYDLIGRVTDMLLMGNAYNLDELKTMAAVMDLNGGIDYSTQDSAARGIVDAMIRQGRWDEVVDYIRETRDNWEI
ncbi:MAG: hypothetical protein AAF485_03565 [Chloroflexota bacterium]